MQVVSYLSAQYKKMLQFFKVESLFNPLTCALDSPYTKHDNLHFHTEHHLNWLPHEYINT